VVVALGVTVKPAPLRLEPIEEPPEETVYQLIVFPKEVALIAEDEPIQMLVGLAVTTEGAEGIPTAIVIGVLVML
jgi:hypothetical protein